MCKNEARRNVERQLREYRDLLKERKQIYEQLERLEDLMESPGGQRLDGMPRGGSGGNRTENIVTQKVALEAAYREKLARIIEQQRAVEDMIDSLPSRERRLLRHYYIDGMTLESICVAMNYSWRQINNIKSAALDRLAAGVV